MGASKNSEFTQMPHKGTPIRYGQKQPVRSRQQGAEKICEHPLCELPAYPASPRRIWVICKQEIFYATQHNQPLGCRLLATLVEWLVVPSVGMKCGFLEVP
jgi:hypothetical protein